MTYALISIVVYLYAAGVVLSLMAVEAEFKAAGPKFRRAAVHGLWPIVYPVAFVISIFQIQAEKTNDG